MNSQDKEELHAIARRAMRSLELAVEADLSGDEALAEHYGQDVDRAVAQGTHRLDQVKAAATETVIALAAMLAEAEGGKPEEGEGMERCWWFPSCAAAKRFYRAAFHEGLRVWASADLAGLLLPSDPAWRTWEVDRSIIP